MNMLLRTLLWVLEISLIAKLVMASALFRCRYQVAARRPEYLELLIHCVGREFNTTSQFTGIAWHTQKYPGYVLDKAGRERASEICWEAPVGVTIYLNNHPALGMAIEFRGPHVCIRQIQGASGVRLPDELKDWPRRFVKGVMNFIYNSPGLVSVRLYTADQRWSYLHPVLHPKDGESTEDALLAHQQRLRHRYDGTARKMGFKRRNPSYYEWRVPKELQTAD